MWSQVANAMLDPDLKYLLGKLLEFTFFRVFFFRNQIIKLNMDNNVDLKYTLDITL